MNGGCLPSLSVPRLQPRAVGGCPGDAPLADFIPQRLILDGIEHLLPCNSFEEPGSRFVKRAEMEDDLQSDQTSDVRMVSHLYNFWNPTTFRSGGIQHASATSAVSWRRSLVDG
jgi:hypothetical protein